MLHFSFGKAHDAEVSEAPRDNQPEQRASVLGNAFINALRSVVDPIGGLYRSATGSELGPDILRFIKEDSERYQRNKYPIRGDRNYG